MGKQYHFLALICAALMLLPAFAQGDVSGEQAQSQSLLEERIGSVKNEVKALNHDLAILEEELLFPSSTQLAVFLSFGKGDFFSLDSVKLQIDDKPLASHVYTSRELEALKRGGVQRLYLGNIKSGEHELMAEFSGPGANDKGYAHVKTIGFIKDEGSKFIELKIQDVAGNSQPEFIVKEWE